MTDSPGLSTLAPAMAPDEETAARWPLQLRRRQMLDGTWIEQLISAGRATVGTSRIEGWGRPSLARNVADSVCRELAVLHDEPAVWTHDLDGAGQIVTDTMAFGGAQSILQRMQTYAIGIGTCYVRVRGYDSATPGGFPRVRFEAVPADVIADAERDDGSDQPSTIREYAPRVIDGAMTWTAEEWDARGDGVYRLLRMSSSRTEVLAELAGPDYPYRRLDGRPILPYVLYHDGPPRVGLHDPHHRESLFAGALDVAVMYWMATHAYKDASWPQRAVMGMEVSTGTAGTDSTGTPYLATVMDPATLATFSRQADYDGAPMQWQWGPGADVEMMYRVIDDLAGRVAVEAGGVSPADLHRSAPNRSGSAISLTNEGKRAAQRRFAGSFRPGDERLASVVATVIRSHGGPTLPESGYRVQYGQLPLSVDEQDARRRHAIEARAAAMMTALEAYMYIHPGMAEADAMTALASMVAPTTPPSPRAL